MTRYKVGDLFGGMPNAFIIRLLARALVLAKLKLGTSAISFKDLPLLGRVARPNAPLVMVLLLVAPVPIARVQNASAPFPSRLGTYLRDAVRLTVEEQQQLAAGEPVTKLSTATRARKLLSSGLSGSMRRFVNTRMLSGTSRTSSEAAGSRSRSESAHRRGRRTLRSCSCHRTTSPTSARAAWMPVN